MKNTLPLAGIQVKNFRAVQDSKAIQFTPLTVFIGNNGSGKSSIVEALETFQLLALHDIDEAMQQWHGFEYIWNKSKDHKQIKGNQGVRFLIDAVKAGDAWETSREQW